MNVEFITTDQFGTYFVDTGDTVYMRPGVGVFVQSGAGIRSRDNAQTDTTVIIDGFVVSFDRHAVSSFGQDANGYGGHEIRVGATGLVRSESEDRAALRAMGSNAVVQNDGTVHSQDVGIFVRGSNAQILNTGLLTAAEIGIYHERVDWGGDIVNSGSIVAGRTAIQTDSTNRVVNSGEITQTGMGTWVSGETAAVYMTGNGTQLFNSGRITARDAAICIPNGGNVENTGTIHSAGSVAIEILSGSGTVVNDGAISGSYAVRTDNSSDYDRYEVLNAGIMHGEVYGVSLRGEELTVHNTGTITALREDAVSLRFLFADGYRADVTNSGTMEGRYNGLSVRGEGDGLARIENSGVIRGGIDSDSNGVYIRDVDASLSNSGLIQGTFTGLFLDLGNGGSQAAVTNHIGGAILGQVYAISSTADTLILRNHGEIAASAAAVDPTDSGAAVHAPSGDVWLEVWLVNRGLISGPATAIDLGTGNHTIRNTGEIAGNVALGDGAHDVRNKGLIDGDVTLGNGGALFNGARGEVTGTVHGGAGSDTLIGGRNDDLLAGGGGADVLTGGRGSDTFICTSAAAIGTGAQSDRITDFTSGEDLIDLSGFAQPLTFIGTAGFSGTAGEVRFNASAQALQGDMTGNGAVDFRLLLDGVTSLEASDLIL